MVDAPAWLKALKGLSRRAVTKDDLDNVIAEIVADKNDRGAALIAASVLETQLETLLREQLNIQNAAEESGIFGHDAPLSTFSDQIRMAYALCLIHREVRADLDRVREIRNAFAHTQLPVDFKTPEIANACNGFHADYRGYKDLPWGDDHPRTQYLGTFGRLMMAITLARKTPLWERDGHKSTGYAEVMMHEAEEAQRLASLEKPT